MGLLDCFFHGEATGTTDRDVDRGATVIAVDSVAPAKAALQEGAYKEAVESGRPTGGSPPFERQRRAR